MKKRTRTGLRNREFNYHGLTAGFLEIKCVEQMHLLLSMFSNKSTLAIAVRNSSVQALLSSTSNSLCYSSPNDKNPIKDTELPVLISTRTSLTVPAI